ncbi:hypothetical protein [Mycetohabitans rhizoxinica]|uniref:hypothetical protein n=1 Tax=Mycetohabitans rhizoxinica TaxID=412963 RepID=UPI0030CA8B49
MTKALGDADAMIVAVQHPFSLMQGVAQRRHVVLHAIELSLVRFAPCEHFVPERIEG